MYKIRTKYLDKEDLKSEGWEYIENDLGFPNYWILGDFNLIDRGNRFYELKRVRFDNLNQRQNIPSYSGKLLSINELHKIMTYLSIK